MHASPTLAPALNAPAAQPSVSLALSPWEIEPVRSSSDARPAAIPAARRIELVDPIGRPHWSVVLLTVVTAALVIVGTRVDDRTPSRVLTWTAGQSSD
jgi:hypothetical protein